MCNDPLSWFPIALGFRWRAHSSQAAVIWNLGMAAVFYSPDPSGGGANLIENSEIALEIELIRDDLGLLELAEGETPVMLKCERTSSAEPLMRRALQRLTRSRYIGGGDV